MSANAGLLHPRRHQPQTHPDHEKRQQRPDLRPATMRPRFHQMTSNSAAGSEQTAVLLTAPR